MAVISPYQERPYKGCRAFKAQKALLSFLFAGFAPILQADNDLKRQNVGTFDKLISYPVVHNKEEL